uniref:F-box domain-containing protein n=1 Tax=Megaselia scalaris TaxID=36166 RepID=T1GNY8_MEGSC
MERVTNALCGGSSSSGNNSSNSNSIQSANNSVIGTPEKPSRNTGAVASVQQLQQQQQQSQQQTPTVTTNNPSSQTNTPQQIRKQLPNPHSIHHQMLQQQLQKQQLHSKKVIPPTSLTVEQLFLDDRFLSKFFMYFSPYERCILAQVCMKWRDLLYRSPRYWSGLIPTLQCRELRQFPNPERVKLYNSLIRRGFHALSLIGAQDEDALDVVHSFPLASKHIHSLSLKCSSISDRGMEALLDHLQKLVYREREQGWSLSVETATE